MDIQVMVFGQLTERTGSNLIWLSGITDSDSLLAVLKENYPKLGESKFAIAIDKKIVSENTPVLPGSTIVIMPPFSGG